MKFININANGNLAGSFPTRYAGCMEVEDSVFEIGNNNPTWVWSDKIKTFVDPRLVWDADAQAYVAPPPAPIIIPDEITMTQCRELLFDKGLYDAVNSAIATMPVKAQIAWEYRGTVRRDSPLVLEVASQIGLTSEQMDQWFLEASNL